MRGQVTQDLHNPPVNFAEKMSNSPSLPLFTDYTVWYGGYDDWWQGNHPGFYQGGFGPEFAIRSTPEGRNLLKLDGSVIWEAFSREEQKRRIQIQPLTWISF